MGSEFGFEDLVVYQKSREFRKRIYKLTKLLPSHEKFELASQMRRASVSLTSNIAEGYGRFTFKDRIHFCRQSRGSLSELVDDINVCIDEDYAKLQHLNDLRQDAVEVHRLLNGFMNYLEKEAQSKRSVRKSRTLATPRPE